MWLGIVVLVFVLCVSAFLIARAGTSADRAIGRDPELGSAAKDVEEDDQELNASSK